MYLKDLIVPQLQQNLQDYKTLRGKGFSSDTEDLDKFNFNQVSLWGFPPPAKKAEKRKK